MENPPRTASVSGGERQVWEFCIEGVFWSSANGNQLPVSSESIETKVVKIWRRIYRFDRRELMRLVEFAGFRTVRLERQGLPQDDRELSFQLA